MTAPARASSRLATSVPRLRQPPEVVYSPSYAPQRVRVCHTKWEQSMPSVREFPPQTYGLPTNCFANVMIPFPVEVFTSYTVYFL